MLATVQSCFDGVPLNLSTGVIADASLVLLMGLRLSGFDNAIKNQICPQDLHRALKPCPFHSINVRSRSHMADVPQSNLHRA